MKIWTQEQFPTLFRTTAQGGLVTAWIVFRTRDRHSEFDTEAAQRSLQRT